MSQRGAHPSETSTSSSSTNSHSSSPLEPFDVFGAICSRPSPSPSPPAGSSAGGAPQATKMAQARRCDSAQPMTCGSLPKWFRRNSHASPGPASARPPRPRSGTPRRCNSHAGPAPARRCGGARGSRETTTGGCNYKEGLKLQRGFETARGLETASPLQEGLNPQEGLKLHRGVATTREVQRGRTVRRPEAAPVRGAHARTIVELKAPR
jgi:hypothetical protein